LATVAVAQQNPLVGTWRGQTIIFGYQAQVELVIMADGRYSQQTVVGTALVLHSGTYRLIPEQNILRFDITYINSDPSGAIRGETNYFQLQDPNTLLTWNVSCQTPDCIIYYQRLY
jgi:hypothetical protein